MSEHEVGNKKRSRIVIPALIVLLLVAAATSVGFYHAYRKAVAATPASQQRSITDQVNSLAITPNEQPQIATVKDASKLTNSALAQRAKNGDILLIYDKASQIIVYRPSSKKIVDMLTVQAPAANNAATTTTAPPTKTTK